MFILVVWWLIGLVVTTANVLAYEGITVHGGGSIHGTVLFAGTPPVAALVTISKDQEVCGKTEKKDESLIVGSNRGVQNAVVSLENVQRGKRFATKNVVLDQKECRYVPHVLLAPTGGEVTILNSDGILHNIHSYSSNNPPFNKAQPKFKKRLTEKFNQAEAIKLACDAHAWMSGWLVVQEHPYYVITDATGHFLLEDIPPGDYEIKVWHESLTEKVQPVRISPNTTLDITVEVMLPLH